MAIAAQQVTSIRWFDEIVMSYVAVDRRQERLAR